MVSEKEHFVSSNSDDMSLFLFIEEQIKKSERDWEVMSSLKQAERSSDEERINPISSSHKSRDKLEGNMISSFIPGHQVMDKHSIYLSEFTAFYIDIRNSSTHFHRNDLLTKFESGLHRVFLETSSLIPVVAHIAEEKGGVATELLGDGALILFPMRKKRGKDVIEDALYVANKSINVLLKYINYVLWEKYKLPPLSIGVGISHSQAMVKAINANGYYHPKVIGQCIWEAAKLSNGNNKVFISKKSFSLLDNISMKNFEVKSV